MELCVAEACVGDAIQDWGWDHAAERARRAEAYIVGHDQQDVWRSCGRYRSRCPIGFRLARIEIDLAPKCRGRAWQIFAVDRGRSTRRTWHRASLLCVNGRRRQREQ